MGRTGPEHSGETPQKSGDSKGGGVRNGVHLAEALAALGKLSPAERERLLAELARQAAQEQR